MISEWQVYWIMQLDEIRRYLSGFSLTAGLISIAALAIGAVLMGMSTDCSEELEKKSFRRGGRFSIVAGVVIMFFCCIIPSTVRAFTPTTKTMACVVVLPAIVNNESIQGEAREVYDMAKEALRGITEQAGDD